MPMTRDSELVIIESDEGVLVLTSSEVEDIPHVDQRSSRALSPAALARASSALGAIGQFQASAGRWVKLDQESARWLKDLAQHNSRVTGVIRGPHGRIAKHMKFEHAGLLTPAAPGLLAAMVAQQALQAALDDITTYLESIDEKLNELLQQRKVESLGQLGGVSLIIDEADRIREQTGTVSTVTWSKVQANTLALQSMHAEALAQLNALLERVRSKAHDVDALAAVLTEVREDAAFWLGILGRTMALQERQYLLELARVEASEPATLDDHREGIRLARTDRAGRIERGLEAIVRGLNEASTLSNVQRLANPFSAQRVTSASNQIVSAIAEFSHHTDLDVASELLESTRWGEAARALFDDASHSVKETGAGVLGGARSLAKRAQERRERAVLSKADRILEKRRDTEDEGPASES